MNVDLHWLYANRSLGRARAFVNRTGAGGGGGGSRGGNANGHGGGASSPGGYSAGGGIGLGLVAGAKAVDAELNRRDWRGRTVLHLASSEVQDWAVEWVELLLGAPGIQVNAADTESGWTALHRALYAGNIAAARLLLAHREIDSRVTDNELLTPFDLYNSTVEGTNPQPSTSPSSNPGRLELFTWGSGRNLQLGFPSDNDRAFPERVALQRKEGRIGLSAFEPIRVKDIAMARLHTGIVTDEALNNVHLCGFGTGGRLGQTTQMQFNFAPLHDFPYEVASVSLSPDHTVVVTTSGDVFTFGLNRHSQLGYTLESPSPQRTKTSAAGDEPIQSIPRRVVGVLKREFVLGSAASRTHTVVFSTEGLFSWGTNKGQLGYSTPGTSIQVMPRKVTSIQLPILMVTCTENATCVLLASREVIVLHGEGYLKITFPLARFPTKMQAYRPPQVSSEPNIVKITSCGNTFAALSSLGDVFTFSIDGSNSTDSPRSSTSSRLAPKPQRLWSLRRNFTSVTDVGVGLDGSIILCTLSGHVFVRTKKFETSAKAGAGGAGNGGGWKFSRVPTLQRVIKVAASSTGAFAAIRSDVPLRPIDVEGPTLTENLLFILPHWRRVGPLGAKIGSRKKADPDEDDEEEVDAGIERDIEISSRMFRVLEKWEGGTWDTPLAGSDCFLVAGGMSFPVHRLVLSSRSVVLADRLATSGTVTLDTSPFALLLLVHYLYADDLPAVWDSRVGSRLRELHPTRQLDIPGLKSDLQHLASALELPCLRQSLQFHVKTVPQPSLTPAILDLLHSPNNADVVLELADRDVRCHSVVLRARCSFFETIYEDGDWTALRTEGGVVKFNLKHFSWEVMEVVLEHVYGDRGVEMFDSIDRPTSDSYIDFVTQVLAASNELLLDKLKLVCSTVLRKFVSLHTVSAILVDAAFYEAPELVRACLFFLASSMETVLESRLLDDLPPDLVTAVSKFCRERQGARMPISRSGLLVQEAMLKHAGWLAELDLGKPTGGARKFRPVVSRSPGPSPSLLSPGPSPQLRPGGSPRVRPHNASPTTSPSLQPLNEASDEPFAMDDFSLDSAPPFAAITNGRRRMSTPQPPSPLTPSFTPIGSPPPLRLQPWNSTPLTSSGPPRDLRSIMATEAASERRPRASPSFERIDASRAGPSTPRSLLSGSSSPWRPSSPPTWRASDSSARPSLADIMATEQAGSQTKASSSSPRSEPPQPTPPRTPSSTSFSTPASPSPSHNPASAIGAPVITPSRLAGSRTPGGTGPRVQKSFGGADVPWTNYNVAPPSPTIDPFSFYSTSSSPPTASFASIQQAQKAELAAIKETKAVRSFQEVMAAEAAAERARVEEVEFERWWAAEAARVQAESLAIHSGGGGGEGPSRGGGAPRRARGAGGGAARGRGGNRGGGGGGGGRGGAKRGRGASDVRVSTSTA